MRNIAREEVDLGLDVWVRLPRLGQGDRDYKGKIVGERYNENDVYQIEVELEKDRSRFILPCNRVFVHTYGDAEHEDLLKDRSQALHSFQEDLEDLINRYSVENGSDTSDFVLAQYLAACLVAFEDAVNHRERLAGREQYPVAAETMQGKRVYSRNCFDNPNSSKEQIEEEEYILDTKLDSIPLQQPKKELHKRSKKHG